MFVIGEVIKEPYTTVNVYKNYENARFIDVLVYPQGYILYKVEIPRVKSNQLYPKLKSMVLVFRQDDFKSKLITILKDPESDLQASLRGEGVDGSDFFKPGEIQHESSGGSFLYLDNKGTAQLSSVTVNEQFVADATTQTTQVLGTNVLISNNLMTNIILDKDNSIIIQNKDKITNVEKANIKIDLTGKITINSALSDIEIKAVLGNIKIDAAQNITINSTQGVNIKSVTDLNIESAGTVNIKGLAAKIGRMTKKLVTSAFVSLFNSHTHPSAAGPTSPPLTPMVEGVHTTTTTEAE